MRLPGIPQQTIFKLIMHCRREKEKERAAKEEKVKEEPIEQFNEYAEESKMQ